MLRLWFSCSRSPTLLCSSLTQTKTLPSRVGSRTWGVFGIPSGPLFPGNGFSEIRRAAASLNLRSGVAEAQHIIQYSVQSLSGSQSEPALRTGKFHPELN
ncbi:hypothetical protein B0H13DRAFT_383654 [Mycena leptocephala]|nr:hypothetical protein B0H13DRAFT_383654 [Mycena leptocephala]